MAQQPSGRSWARRSHRGIAALLWPARKMWQHPPADPLVITDYVAFGDAVSGKQHLLVAQSQKARVPQFAFGRPFGETNLGYQLGLHPMHSRAGHPVSGEWTHTGL